MRQTATAEVRLDESKAGSFSDRAPSIAGSISFARGDGELPLPKSFNGAILVPKVPEPGECWLRDRQPRDRGMLRPQGGA